MVFLLPCGTRRCELLQNRRPVRVALGAQVHGAVGAADGPVFQPQGVLYLERVSHRPPLARRMTPLPACGSAEAMPGGVMHICIYECMRQYVSIAPTTLLPSAPSTALCCFATETSIVVERPIGLVRDA